MKVICHFFTLCLLLVSTITYSQKTKEFSGQWSYELGNLAMDYWQIKIDKISKKGTSSFTVWGNQLGYSCTNKLQGDTLLFYFQNYDAGRGGGGEIAAGNIKIPKKGKLIGKAVIKSEKLIFIYTVKNMALGETYILNKEHEQTN